MKAIMTGIKVDLSESLHPGSKSVQDLIGESSCHEAITSYAQQSHCEGTDNSIDEHLLDKGYLEYGCTHYRRRCRIRAPCCNEIFDCRHCHNELKMNLDKDGHCIPQHQVRQVICSLCNTEQEVQQICIKCGVCMGRYFCGICKLFDDDTSKKAFHCSSCGVCWAGGQDHLFHCNKCQCCFPIQSKESHFCVEGRLHCNCPVCLEHLFEGLGNGDHVSTMCCGHDIHRKCFTELKKFRHSCPLCSKTIKDMSRIWKIYDLEVATTPMPLHLQNEMIWILCNDCNSYSVVQFHIHLKCPDCKSYNTRKIATPTSPKEILFSELVTFYLG